MMTLASMELDPDEAAEAATPIQMDHVPQYPYGMRVCLTDDEMEKLGIDPADAKVGGYFMLHALCCITSVSSNKTEDGDCSRMEAQIEQASVDGEDASSAETPAAPRGQINYKGSVG